MAVIRFLMTAALLGLVYCMALSSFAPLDYAFGFVLGGILTYTSREFIYGGPVTGPSPIARFFAFFPFLGAVVWQALTGTVQVVLATIHLRPWPRSGLVEVPTGERSPTAIAVWAVITGLPPGSYFVDVDREREVVYIHLFDASDPDGYRRQVARFYERFQRKVFP